MSFFGGGGNDPFFGDVHRHMFRQMEEMDALMNRMMTDPFGGLMGGVPAQGVPRQPRDLMIDDGRGGGNLRVERAPEGRREGFGELMPFGGGLLGGGGLFGGLMRQMEHAREHAMTDPNSHVYSHSTVVSMGPGRDGQMDYYEETRDVRKAGQVKETRRSVRDSASGREKMSIGHHIGDRAHIIEKKRGKDGQIEEKQKFRNLREEEARRFDDEWAQSTSDAVRGRQRAVEEEPYRRPQRPAIDRGPSNGRRRRVEERHTGPVIEEIHDDEAEEHGREEGRGRPYSDSKRPRGGVFNKFFNA